MSVGFPSLRPQPGGTRSIDLPEGSYGVPDQMLHGFQNARSGQLSHHELEFSEKHWHGNQTQLDFKLIRDLQGMHGPLKLQMERNIAGKMQRLPGLSSSNILLDTLTGRDDILDFQDILNNPAESEFVGDAHVLMEKKLNIL